MFARVLFPTDFSVYANTVFDCVPELKSAGMREVILLSVIRTGDVPMPETVNRESLEYWRWSLEEQLNIARIALEGRDLRVTARVEYGNTVEQILRVAYEEQVELITIGAQGMTATQELLIGSVAYGVVRRAAVPVLVHKFDVIREMGHIRCRRVCEKLFTRILHPTDFSECANEAFQIVKQLKAAGTEEVIVLHVQDERVMKQRSDEQLAEFDRQDTERLEALCRALRMYGLRARSILRHGIPFRETLQVAEEMDAYLIVLGSHGRSAVREMLSGSTLDNVVRLSRQPVLVIRRSQEETQ